MKRSLLHSLLSAALLLGGFSVQAEEVAAFDDRYYVAPMAAVAQPRASRSDDPAYGGAVAIGKFLVPHLSVELLGNYLRYQGKTVSTTASGNCGLLTPCPESLSHQPAKSVWLGGIGANYYLLREDAGLFLHANLQGGENLTYNLGLGFDQALFKGAAHLRAEVLYHRQARNETEPLLQLGLRIPLGAAPLTVPAAEAELAVVPVAPEAAVETAPVPTAESSDLDTAAPAAPVSAAEAAPAPAPTLAPAAVSKKPAKKRHKKAVAPLVPAAPAPVPAPPPSEPPSPPAPPPAADGNDDAAAPTEPAPAPPGAARAVDKDAPPSRPAARERSGAPSSDDGSAPTEAAPTPPGGSAAPSGAANVVPAEDDGSVPTEPAPAPPKP